MKRCKYSRLSLEDRKKIKHLTLNGKSLRQISKIMSLGITTIYYHVRKFKPKIQKDFIVNLPDEKIGELVGAFAGDGSYYLSSYGKAGNHKIRYHLCFSKDKDYVCYLVNLLKSLNLNPFLINRKDGDGLDILVNSRSYIDFIKKFLIWEGKKTYSVRLRKCINGYSDEFLVGFARGLMDTDGFVETYNVSCGCVSKRLIKNLSDIFEKFGILSKTTVRIRDNRSDLFLVRVRNKVLDKYFNIVGFSNFYKADKLRTILK